MTDVPDNVKRRSYDASRRQAGSVATRRRIVEAARELLLARGYRATTISAIAEEADVNADTIYELVGRKPALLRELIEQAVSGTDHPVPVDERDYVRAVRAERDPVRKLAIYAKAVRRTQSRLAPLYRIIREAAPGEPEVAALWQEISSRRAGNMRLFVTDVSTAGPLREDLGLERAADVVWALNSPDVYLLLTEERGWTPDEFERWLADAWQRLLLA